MKKIMTDVAGQTIPASSPSGSFGEISGKRWGHYLGLVAGPHLLLDFHTAGWICDHMEAAVSMRTNHQPGGLPVLPCQKHLAILSINREFITDSLQPPSL